MGNGKSSTDEFCMKGMNFHYVLDKPLRGMLNYEKMASTEQGKQKLNLNGSPIECLLFVITDINGIGTILPSGNIFGGTGPSYPGNKGNTIEEMANELSGKLTNYSPLYKKDPRAIVHAERESDFIKATKSLGMKPVKLGEEMFSEGF